MSEPARHLRGLPSSGQVPKDGPQSLSEALIIIGEQNRKLNGAWAENATLRNRLAEMQAVEPEAEQILDVLEFWREKCMPGASIVVGEERWVKVRQRLRAKDAKTKRPLYTPLHLRAAVVGALLDPWMVGTDPEKMRKNGGKVVRHLDATTIFRDSATVDKHIARATGFKQRTGISALTLLDELAGGALDWLADRCSCGGLFIEHLRSWPSPEGHLPCPERNCEGFDFLNAKVERTLVGAA